MVGRASWGLGLVLAVGACAHGPGAMPVMGAPASSVVRAAFAMPDVTPAKPAPPMELTASDGTGLAIVELKSRSTIKGPLVETELTLTFENPEWRRLEGRFRIALPPRAFTSRLAMKIDGKWTEADVAELAAAREVYEDVLHRRRDPLLVEQREDNELSARVFPIEPRQRKEIIVAWVAELSAERPIVVPLLGVPKIGKLDVAVAFGASEPYVWRAENVTPHEDVRYAPANVARAARAGETLVARVTIPGETREQSVGDLVVLLDTSASRAADLARDLGLLADVVRSLAAREPDARIVVGAFDQRVETMYDGPMRGFDASVVQRVRARGALGASDLGQALSWAEQTTKRVGAKRGLFVGDGIATAGETHRVSIGTFGTERVDVVTTAALRDAATLRALAKNGVVIEEPASSEAVVSRLRTSMAKATTIAVPGARWISTTSIEGAQPGDERFVYADVPAWVTPRLVVDGREESIVDATKAEPIHARAVAKAKIDRMTEVGLDDASSKQVVALSKKHRVPSTLTALVVLETDEDRKALAKAGKPPPPPPPPPKVDALTPPPSTPPTVSRAGTGKLRAGHHVAKTPMLRMGMTQVSGRLPPESIRVVVRTNFGRFRGCYTEGLLRNSKLRGRIATRFVIARDGSVREVADAGSDLPDAKVVACVVDAFKGLAFPQPEGGIVVVTYPIVFMQEGDETELVSTPTYNATQSPRRLVTPTPWTPPPPPKPWRGAYEQVRDMVAAGDASGAVTYAATVRATSPFDVATLLALGEAFEAAGLHDAAARAYGSLADVYPHRAEILRLSGGRLRTLARVAPAVRPLAIQLLRRARDDRPDEPTSHHLLAMAYLEAGSHEDATATLELGLARGYAPRYGAAGEVLREDLRIVAAAWSASEPSQAGAIRSRLSGHFTDLPTGASTFLVLTWETDVSDIGLDVRAPWSSVSAASDGFGPKMIKMTSEAEVPVGIDLSRKGPTANEVGGVVDVLTHDGRGYVTVEPRPFFVMTEGASVALGGIPPNPRLGRVSPSSGSLPRSPN